MRITNKMMSNNMMSNINKNKLGINTLEEQYSSGKKIQRPSDDPIIAVRALKLRTNLSEINQYYEKNIPDAQSWMDVTESALKSVNEILSQVNTYCVQGSTDTLTAEDRSSIAKNLEQMKKQIIQEGNTNYAGRYVFTGYKTDSSLTFTEEEPSLTYSVTQKFSGNDINIMNKVSGSYELSDYDNTATVDFSKAPQMNETYRLQLAYDKLSTAKPESIKYYTKDASGNLIENIIDVNSVVASLTSSEQNAYTPDPNQINYLSDTGELILSSEVYNELRNAQNIEVTYSKTGFNEGDLKPEHYFTCTMSDSSKPDQDPINYVKPDAGQEIQYEINYNQKLTINTEGSDSITHNMGRCIDDIISTVNAVTNTEKKIAEVETRLKDTSLSTAEIERYNKMKEQLETELSLKKEVMQKAFEMGNSTSSKEQDRVNTAVANLGSRMVRLQLTENRLSSQKVDFEDLLSTNEDVDMVDTYIKYGSAETIYNASLNAASKVVKNTLMNFL